MYSSELKCSLGISTVRPVYAAKTVESPEASVLPETVTVQLISPAKFSFSTWSRVSSRETVPSLFWKALRAGLANSDVSIHILLYSFSREGPSHLQESSIKFLKFGEFRRSNVEKAIAPFPYVSSKASKYENSTTLSAMSSGTSQVTSLAPRPVKVRSNTW